MGTRAGSRALRALFLSLLACLPWRAFAAAPAAAAAAEDQCLVCHEKKADRIQYDRHTLEQWKASPHAPTAAGCADCHGGDPKQTDAFKAHRGVLGSGDPKSPIYYQNLPETCGRCHRTELDAFKRSKHYEMLSRKGKGPTCTTCHGAMDATVPSAAKLNDTCALCHAKPNGASDVILILQQSEALLSASEGLMEKGGAKARTPERLAVLKQGREAVARAVQDWHAFDLDSVRVQAKTAFSAAKQIFKQMSPSKTDDGGAR